MKNYLSLYLIFFIIMICFSQMAFAQFPIPGGGGKGGQQGGGGMAAQIAKMNIGRVYGKLVDAKTKKPVEFASVALLKFSKDSAIAGQLSSGKGEFSLDNLPFGTFRLRLSFLGYKTIEKRINVAPTDPEQDLGDFIMESDEKTIKEVVVSDQKSTVKLAIDRRVFNVDKDISSRGGTGTDVMKNIPGVTVDADGNVTLRNNTPQIYVDGKPTTLTLDQIPADQIDRVEVITNPSAKYEAAAGGGILNVVLKADRKPGYNGIVSAGIGTNTQYTGMGVLNLHERKFGILLTYNLNSVTNPTTGYSNLTSLLDGQTIGHYNQDIAQTLKRTFQFARIGFDYYISNRNTLTIAENLVFGKFKVDENQKSTFLDANDQQIQYGTRENLQTNQFRNFGTTIDFKHTYPRQGKEYTISVAYNHSHGDNSYLYTTDSYLPNGSLLPNNPQLQQTNGRLLADQWTAQWDFTHPLRDSLKLEYGLRSSYKLSKSYLDVDNFDYPSNNYVKDTALSNNYKIDDLVNAAYVTLGQQVHKFSYQLGLRFEHTYYAGTLLDKGESFSYQYPLSLAKLYQTFFPSLNLSEKINDANELQINFSRKINRPNFFQISPFIFYSDKNNYRIGNPALQPEFSNQVELNYNLVVPKFNWLSSVYGRYTEQPISSYNYRKPGPIPSSVDSLVLISSYTNSKNAFTYGWENTMKINPTKDLDITLNANVFYTLIQSVSTENVLSENSGYACNGKAIVTYRFPQSFTAQINGNYESPKIVPQGKTLSNYSMDISVSKDFNQLLTINLTVSDVFNTRRNGTHYDTPEYIQDLSRRRDTRYAKIGVTFKFGKLDSSILKLRKMKKGDPSGGGNGDGLDF